jgi:glycosyltransferase involved in cell wall biosynthesis
VRYFGVAPDRVHVVPNGAEERFSRVDPLPFVRAYGLRNFVLYAGRIEPRKNQLNFLRAVRPLAIPTVVLGNAVAGHECYYDQCRREAGPTTVFIPPLDRDGPLLAGAYASCHCLALASWYETPGLVALEAGMSGVPLVLPEGGCAREYFGDHADYVRPNRLADIRRAVAAAMTRDRNPQLAAHVQSRFTWRAAAEETCRAYLRVMRRTKAARDLAT